MNDFENTITQMDFEFFGTGQHIIEVESFLKGMMVFSWT